MTSPLLPLLARRCPRALATALAALALAATAHATLRTYHTEVTIINTNAQGPQIFPGDIEVGDKFSLEFTLDDAASIVNSSGNNVYYDSSALKSMRLWRAASNIGSWTGAESLTGLQLTGNTFMVNKSTGDILIRTEYPEGAARVIVDGVPNQYLKYVSFFVHAPLATQIPTKTLAQVLAAGTPTAVNTYLSAGSNGDTDLTFSGSGEAQISVGTILSGVDPQFVDKIAPRVKITSPTTSSGSDFFISIEGTVQENKSLASFRVLCNGAEQSLNYPVSPSVTTEQQWVVGTVLLENGTNSIAVEAIDWLGNKTVVTRSFLFRDPNVALLAGGYSARLGAYATPSIPDSIDTNGLLTITVSASGAFTGKVQLSGGAIPVSGLLKSDGSARFNPGLSDTAPLHDRTDYWIYLGALNFTIGTSRNLDARIYDDALKSNIVTYGFGGENHTAAKPVPASIVGIYNIAWPTVEDGTTRPKGSCIARATVAANGAVSVVGTLADGTPLRVATTAIVGGSFGGGTYIDVPLYAAIYRKAGVFVDQLTIGAGIAFGNAGECDAVSNHKPLWSRPPQRRARYYPDGWESHTNLSARGAKWVGVATLDFGQGASDLSEGNCQLTLEGGDLPGGDAGFQLNLPPTGVDAGKVTIPTLHPSAGLSVSLSTKTGTFTGKTSAFTPPNAAAPGLKPLTFSGIVLNKPGFAAETYGWFLAEPTVDTYHASGHGGNVSIQP